MWRVIICGLGMRCFYAGFESHLHMPDLEKFLRKNAGLTKKIVIVSGWSHSGALIEKNILFISDKLESEGIPRVPIEMLASDYPKFRYTDPATGRVVHNNNGLDGDSARIVAGMIIDPEISAKYEGQWQYKILDRRITYRDVPDEKGISVVCAIGFKPGSSITVNGKKLSDFTEAHPHGGSFKNGIFIAGFTSPIKDDENAPIVGITKVFDITQRLAQLAICVANLAEKRPNRAGFFADWPVVKGGHGLEADDICISGQPVRSKL